MKKKKKVRGLCIYLVCWSTFKNLQIFLHPDMLMHLTWALVLLINPVWLLEITASLFVLLLQAATSISVLISQLLCTVSNIKTIINHWHWKTGVCPSLRAEGWEGHCLHSLTHPPCSLPPVMVSLQSVCQLPFLLYTCGKLVVSLAGLWTTGIRRGMH